MNRSNYVTLEQAKRMRELGYPQDETDYVWIVGIEKGLSIWLLSSRENACLSSHIWYAAPNAQEIELKERTLMYHVELILLHMNHAQARANAWIWEKEKK
jgi:hypothetical protein